MDQLRLADVQSHIYTVEDVLEEQHKIERDLRTADAAQHLQEVAELRSTLGAGHLDLYRSAQQALEQREQLRATIGEETLAAAIAAGQRVQATPDVNRVADITKQLDLDYLGQTLTRAQQLLSDSAVNEMLAQADAQAILRDAEEAVNAYTPSESEEITVGPPEWMRRLSREQLVAIVELLELYVDSLIGVYYVVSVFTEAPATEDEVEAVLGVLRVALVWARYRLKKSEDDD